MILGLRDQVDRLVARETDLVRKLEQVDGQARSEYQRLVEMNEGGNRYKEVRDLYEEKLARA